MKIEFTHVSELNSKLILYNFVFILYVMLDFYCKKRKFVNWLTFQQTAKNFIIQPGASPVRSYWYKIQCAISSVYQSVAERNTSNQYFSKAEPLQQSIFYIKDLQVGGHGPLPPTCLLKKSLHITIIPFRPPWIAIF